MTVKIAGRGPQVSGVAAGFLVLSTIAIILRCYCRVLVVKSFGLDDWAAVIAWVLFVFFGAFAITGVYHGTGQHIGTFPLTEVPVGLKWWWACEPVYVLSNMALKLSIGVFLLRIAVAKVHKIIIWTSIAIAEIYGTFFFFLFVLQCRPSAYFWTQYTGGKGSCIDPSITVNATYGYSAVSCAVDWTLGIIPVFIVWNLQMNPRTKLVVAMILALGAVASSATIVRIPYVKDLANQADFLWATTDVAIWSIIETGIGITASALATLRPLFRTFFSRKKLMGDTSSRGTATHPWSKRSNASFGYLRSGSKNGLEEFGLTASNGKNIGITTTTVKSDRDLERQDRPEDRHIITSRMRAEPTSPLDRGCGWNSSEPKIAELDRSSDDERMSWRQQGIMKTVSTDIER